MNEAALKDRLKLIAKEKSVTFNEIWKQLLLERFLARLANSTYRDRFIFKDGLLLAQYIKIGRETDDVDFLMTKIQNEHSTVQSSICAIIATPIDDGFQFEWDSMEILKQPHMDYFGFRAAMHAFFGGMKDKIHMDIGVGDHVIPDEKDIRPFEYKGKPLFVGEITMMVYPVESIFSEKLETIISKGSYNSRMKDYHDVLLMIRENNLLKKEVLLNTLHATFQQRATSLILPIQFDEQGLKTLQGFWSNHLRGLAKIKSELNFPVHIKDVLDEINKWLMEYR